MSEIEETACDRSGGMPAQIASRIRTVFEKWTAAGQDPDRFRAGTVKFTYNGVTSERRAWKALR